MEVPLSPAVLGHLRALCAAAEAARRPYEDALRLLCLQGVANMPERCTITPDWEAGVLRVAEPTEPGA